MYCSECGSELQFRDEFAGKIINCPFGKALYMISALCGLGLMIQKSSAWGIFTILISGLAAYGLYLYRNYVVRTEIEKLEESHQVLVIDYKYCNELVNKLKVAYQN